MRRICLPMTWAVLLLGCPATRDLPPPPEAPPAETKDRGPSCGKVFKDPKSHHAAGCCVGPAAQIVRSADVAWGCALLPESYLGEARDGAACRFHFKTPSGAAAEAAVMVSHPVIPTGSPAPTGPDPMLPWSWKKISLRDARGFQAIPSHEGKPPEDQTILWAGRGRHIVGLQIPKVLCSEAQAYGLLQKAIDAPP